MLMSLDDDCVELIFNLLELSDQLMIRHVCKRFATNISSVWRRKTRKVAIKHGLMYELQQKGEEEHLLELLTAVSPIAEELQLSNLYTRNFRKLHNLKFPNVSKLELYLWNDDNEECNDDDTMLLYKMFPNVVNLSISSAMTGQHLWLFTQVRDLNIGGCEYLDEKYFAKIFGALQLRRLSIMFYGYNTVFEEPFTSVALCKTIEELIIDDHHLLLLIGQLGELPLLRRIVCYTRDYDTYLLEQLATAYGPLMERMVFNDTFWSKDEHMQSVLRMTNLRTFILQDDDMDLGQLERIAVDLKGLRELRVRKSRFRQSEGDSLGERLLKVLRQLPHLEILDLSDTKIDSDFLKQLIGVVDKQTGRTAPLRFYCAGTPLADNFSEEQPLPKQLKVITQEQDLQLNSARIFECNWTPVTKESKT